VFDVAHQGYVHKMLTGPLGRAFTPSARHGGLNGFLYRTESEHDASARATPAPPSPPRSAWPRRATSRVATSTSSRRGDAAFTCGIPSRRSTTSSLDQAPHRRPQRQRVVHRPQRRCHREILQLPSPRIRLRESASEGREIRRVHARRRCPPLRRKVEGNAKNMLLPQSQTPDESQCSSMNSASATTAPSTVTTADLLIQTFEFLKTQDEPVILHIITEKGRGYSRAQRSRQIPRPRQIQQSRPAKPPPATSPPTRRSSPAASRTSPRRTKKSSPSPPPCRRHRPERFQKGNPRALLRRRHRRGTRRALRLRSRHAGPEALPHDSTPPSCSAPST
jgi:hypothetical protein